MSRQDLTRIIEAVVFEGEIGSMTARELIAKPEDQWGLLRDRITDGHNGSTTGLVCRCAFCKDPVFIRSSYKKGVRYPLFSHYGEGRSPCIWRHAPNRDLDKLRGEQYQGRQESELHRTLCERIAELARLDPRCECVRVESYRRPEEGRGRFPDVNVIWKDLPECVFEVQLSHTFQAEISARTVHYAREGVFLIWVLFGPAPVWDELPQNFRDVIRRHRNNAFLIDADSIVESYRRRTVVLKCFLRDTDNYFEEPRLVSVDDLVFPENGGSPYVEDRLFAPMLNAFKMGRKTWLEYMETIANVRDGVEQDTPARRVFLNELKDRFPVLTTWVDDDPPEESVLRLLACVATLITHAQGRRPRIYGTQQPNAVAMLNTWLHSRSDIQRNALLLETLIRSTPFASKLDESLGEHIKRAKTIMDGNLCLKHEPEWDIMRDLVPEIFHNKVRAELSAFGALPSWATPPTSL